MCSHAKGDICCNILNDEVGHVVREGILLSDFLYDMGDGINKSSNVLDPWRTWNCHVEWRGPFDEFQQLPSCRRWVFGSHDSRDYGNAVEISLFGT